jgi:predicted translin family RNA/ssDNA-binding protein
MLDKKDLELIKRKIDGLELEKDFAVKQSRDIIKLSKKVIYALHRNDLKGASAAVAEMKSGFSKLDKGCKDSKIRHSGSFKVAVQEFVEALCFYELMKDGKMPLNSVLKLDPEYFLTGLIDLTGELVRKAINSAINGDYQTSVNLKKLVSELYDELLLFDFAGGELRKKFDSVKYDLKKLDDLVLSLKLSGKI